MRRLDVACDAGGAFLDLVAFGDGAPIVVKRPRAATLPAMLRDALDAAGVAPEEVARLRLSTTLAANALLAGQGASVALVATAGFTDVPERPGSLAAAAAHAALALPGAMAHSAAWPHRRRRHRGGAARTRRARRHPQAAARHAGRDLPALRPPQPCA
jgi:hypothetical protein